MLIRDLETRVQDRAYRRRPDRILSVLSGH